MQIPKADVKVFKQENRIPILNIITDEVAVLFNSLSASQR
jgi:hypothetical protein